MNKPTYTPDQIAGKFISCASSFAPGYPCLNAVVYSSGEKANSPVLYNSIVEAQEDMFFDDEVDFVLSASEYFERINH